MDAHRYEIERMRPTRLRIPGKHHTCWCLECVSSTKGKTKLARTRGKRRWQRDEVRGDDE